MGDALHTPWSQDHTRRVPIPASTGLADGDTVRVRTIKVIPGKVGTFETHVNLPVANDHLESDIDQDMLKTFVFERHHETGKFGYGFTKGFSIKRGAMASTIAHNTHNLLVMSTNDKDVRGGRRTRSKHAATCMPSWATARFWDS